MRLTCKWGHEHFSVAVREACNRRYKPGPGATPEIHAAERAVIEAAMAWAKGDGDFRARTLDEACARLAALRKKDE